MNNHVIFGVIASKVRLASSSNGHCFLSFRVQDKTKYNGESNRYNNFPIIKYGEDADLQELQKSLETGTVVYVSGEGLYNQKRYYNIIANRIEIIDNLKAEVVTTNTSYYEQFLEEIEASGKEDE